MIGLYLVYEAVLRFIDPPPVQGWLIVIIAGIALAVDAATALLTYALSKQSMNIRAAFVHNVADALGSTAVIVAGTLIILYDWRIIDPVVTVMIAGYILWIAFSEIGGSIRILMLGTPPDIGVDALVGVLRGVEGVQDVHHLHVWAIDEDRNSLEAHIVVADETGERAEAVKDRINNKAMAHERFGIGHTTLELEYASSGCEGEEAKLIGHRIGAARHSHNEQ